MEPLLFNPIEPVEPPLEEDFSAIDEPIVVPEVAQRPDYRAKDKELYDRWAMNKTPENLSALLQHLHPIIQSQINKQAGSVARAALLGTAQIWAAKAVKTYDPNKGAALSTWVTSYIQKINRTNYQMQNVARLPENKQREYKEYKKALTNLSDELDRDPSEEELAKHLGWSKGRVVKFRGLLFKDLIESESPTPSKFTEYSDTSLLMQELMNRLTPQERMIIELKGTIPAPQLAAKLGVDTNRLNYLQRKLLQKIGTIRQEIGL